MSIHNIKRFSIYALFGFKDVHISFDENIKILVGENGLGKTQVLNIFYYTLTTNFTKLAEFSFEKIELEFKNETELITIVKEECNINHQYLNNDPQLKSIIKILQLPQFRQLRENIENNNKDEIIIKLKNDPRYINLHRMYPRVVIENLIELLVEANKSLKEYNYKFVKISSDIEKKLSSTKIIYFPTFRRIEEDLYNLGYSEENIILNHQENQLINFGMDDVKKRFEIFENKIDSLMKKGFTKITSEILRKLIKGAKNQTKEILERIDKTDIDIILARVGEQLSFDEKSALREIVVKNETSDSDTKIMPLIYLLQALIDIYEEQKIFDDSINKFKKVCNQYLINKKVVYDETNIRISVESSINKQTLNLNQLSSGEKQIISIFSTIYLSEDNEKFIVLFDEPELSLSMTWQKKLLPDIVNSGKCDFLLAVTHSPFIFDNELDKYAIGLNEYFKTSETVSY